MTPNFPELKRLNLWVQAQDKLEPGARIWDQHVWVSLREDQPMCKTAYCAAGVTIVRAGHELTIDSGLHYSLDGERIGDEEIPKLADEILGIDLHKGIYYENEEGQIFARVGDEDEWDLYAESNSAADIDRKIRKIFADHDVSYSRTKAAPDRKIAVEVIDA